MGVFYCFTKGQKFFSIFHSGFTSINEFSRNSSLYIILFYPASSLKVNNIIGNEAANLVDEVQREGSHSVTFNAGNLASGVYLYTLIVNDYIAVKKMSLIK